MTWTFGISEVTTWPWSFDEDLARYRALGATAIEVWEWKLDRAPDARRRQLAAVAGHGLQVSSFQADVHSLLPTAMSPQPHDPAARAAAFAAVLDACAPLVPGAVFVLNTGIAAGGDVDGAWKRTVGPLRELTRRAAALGVRLALEPLHPLATGTDTFIWNLDDARRFVDEIGDAAFGICADAWNLAGQHDLAAQLAACGTRVTLAQVAGWRTPRSHLDRVGVGDGTLDLHPFLAGLRAAGYAGPLVLEVFSRDVPDSLYDGDLAALVTRSRETLARLSAAHA